MKSNFADLVKDSEGVNEPAAHEREKVRGRQEEREKKCGIKQMDQYGAVLFVVSFTFIDYVTYTGTLGVLFGLIH